MTDIVAGLSKRRAELSGEAETLRARLAAIGTDLAHLDAVIRQFDPDHDIAAIRPKRTRTTDAAGHGEMSRAILAVLREASEPLSTVEVAERLGKSQDADAANKRAMRLLTKRVGMTLSHQRAKGTVRSLAGPGAMGLWEVTR
jgi:hypothetical protein